MFYTPESLQELERRGMMAINLGFKLFNANLIRDQLLFVSLLVSTYYHWRKL